MDERKLTTEDVLTMGIVNMPAPVTDIPEDRENFRYENYGTKTTTDDEFRAALLRGAVVACPEYYGIPVVWKTNTGEFRCLLLQYRNVTEDKTFGADEVERAMNWFKTILEQVEG